MPAHKANTLQNIQTNVVISDMRTVSIDRAAHAPRPVADCFRYLADFSTCEQWDPAVYRAEKLTPGAPRIGTEFRVIVSLGMRRKTLRYRIDDLVTGQRLVLTGRGAGVKTQEQITLAADGDGTHIAYEGCVSLRGPLARASRVLAPVLRRMVRTALAGLVDALKIETRTPRQGWLSYAADRSLVAGEALYTDRGYFAMADRSHAEFMDDATVAVTGATGGIGRRIAAEYARLGARVLLVGRDEKKLAAAADFVRGFAGCATDRVVPVAADLATVAATADAAARIAELAPRLDVLVNNAGAMFDEYGQTDDGRERTLAINLVAPFVLTEGLMPSLLAAGGRVVNMSSGGMYAKGLDIAALDVAPANYDALGVYARTKRALVALSAHWARRYGDAGVRFNAMHPGWVDTPGVADALPRFHWLLRPVLRDTRMGADTAVWLGAAEAAHGLNGAFVFDRMPRPRALVPGTKVKPSDAQSLYGWLRNETGIEIHGLR
ncbi:SDR family NAD(P)-dependent oxidoreductase [Salinisphaera sp. Q1T1-3]|uniref:SDR family NAD(P)-dependent oxidoreductase n=1 Tax=Salinisphaera sp. Q1T1-3 TaxID=2321229 RepID=UPI000E76ED0A|nr:SDR family NAD(P)-dependent oxidoreductase [Salinisphaera sp. Q1T1-3]RJS94460.1 SDR family NAD(P)-dependent oxidoreductase [Salinisphaera sp. Q1T1-3]